MTSPCERLQIKFALFCFSSNLNTVSILTYIFCLFFDNWTHSQVAQLKNFIIVSLPMILLRTVVFNLGVTTSDVKKRFFEHCFLLPCFLFVW